MKRTNLFLLFVLMGCFCMNNLVFARQDVDDCCQDCIRNFSLENMEQSVAEELNFEDLAQYARCVSFFDESQIIEKISSFQRLKAAHDKQLRFLLAILEGEKSTPEFINRCVECMKYGRLECRRFIEAFRIGDTSVCNGFGECIGLITQDESLYKKQSEKNDMFFLKAVKNLNEAECDKIQDNPAKRFSCRAYIKGDYRECEKYKGFYNFKKNYCLKKCRKLPIVIRREKNEKKVEDTED